VFLIILFLRFLFVALFSEVVRAKLIVLCRFPNITIGSVFRYTVLHFANLYLSFPLYIGLLSCVLSTIVNKRTCYDYREIPLQSGAKPFVSLIFEAERTVCHSGIAWVVPYKSSSDRIVPDWT